MKNLSQYPTAIGGLCLGLAGICAFWSAVMPNKNLGHVLLWLGFVVAFTLLMPLFFRFFYHPKLLMEDIKHPTIGSIVPTSAMALMLLSHTLGLLSTSLAIAVWCVAVVAHILFFMLFVYYRARDFDLNHLVPSWFVPPIGIVVACLTVPAPYFLPVADLLLCFGMVSYVILLPIVLYRLSLGEKIENTRKPSLAILAAPASLTLSGYLTLIAAPNPLLVLFFFSIAIVMTVSVYLMLFHLLRLSFTPACTAFTFPLAISATAMYKSSLWFHLHSLFQPYAAYFHLLSLIEGVLATAVIVYIFQQMLRFMKKAIFC